MNKEDIARMAHDAMIDIKDEFGNWIGCALDKEKFATLVAAHEREECAKFCDDQYEFYGFDHVFAAGIRARGEK